MAKTKSKKKKGNKKDFPMFNFSSLGGRPPIYAKKEEMFPIIDGYFKSCIKYCKIPSKAGLRIALGFSRENYSTYRAKEEFLDTMRTVENLIEEAWVQKLTSQSTSGIVFYLKNAFKDDYRDRQELEHTGNLTIAQVLSKLRQKPDEQIEEPK